MNDIYNARTADVQLMRTIKFTCAVAFGLFVSLIVDSSPFRWGLSVGAVVGIVNAFLTYNRIMRIAGMTPNQAIGYMRRGFAVRLIMIMAVLFLALRVPGLDIYGVAFGLFIAPIITMVDFNISLIKDYKAHHTLKNKN